MEYNLKYKHIRKDVINLVRDTILKYKIFRRNKNHRLMILEFLNNKLCACYNIPIEKTPHLRTHSINDGCYVQILNTIYLSEKLSLITFLHEFKHFLQHHFNKPNSENIARGYSISLFYLASPRHFKRALRKGLILHQKPK